MNANYSRELQQSNVLLEGKDEFSLQTTGENAAVEKTIATYIQLTVIPGKIDVTKIFS